MIVEMGQRIIRKVAAENKTGKPMARARAKEPRARLRVVGTA